MPTTVKSYLGLDKTTKAVGRFVTANRKKKKKVKAVSFPIQAR